LILSNLSSFDGVFLCFKINLFIIGNYNSKSIHHNLNKMDLQTIILVIIVGFFSGVINTLAGNGSLLSLPLLMFLGLPANIANGTNRIGILLQSIVASSSFKHQKVLETKSATRLTIPAVIGSLIGAQLAVELNEVLMRQAIGAVLVVMFFLIILKPNAWIKGKTDEVKEKKGIMPILIFFSIGFYGGFIQAGVGLFLLAALVLGAGYDLVKANALKVFIVLVYTIFALSVFIFNGQVDYTLGFTLAIGNMLGAYVAAKYAVSWGASFIRYVLLVVILFSAFELFGVIDLF